MKNNEVPLPKNDGKHRKWLYEIELLYANFELHRPAFMTLEPIRWRYKFCWLRNDEYFEQYNNNIVTSGKTQQNELHSLWAKYPQK